MMLRLIQKGMTDKQQVFRLVQKKYADADDNIIVRVHQFRGYHEYANYEITDEDLAIKIEENHSPFFHPFRAQDKLKIYM